MKIFVEFMATKENEIIIPVETTKNIKYYLIDDILYTSYEIKEKILDTKKFLIFLTDDWEKYEPFFDLDNYDVWGFLLE